MSDFLRIYPIDTHENNITVYSTHLFIIAGTDRYYALFSLLRAP